MIKKKKNCKKKKHLYSFWLHYGSATPLAFAYSAYATALVAVSVSRSGRKKPQRVLPNPKTRHWTCQVKAEKRQCPSLPPLTDPFANPKTAAFAVPQQQRYQSPGEREPERPRERTPGGIGASAGEAHRSAHPNSQHKECVYPHPFRQRGQGQAHILKVVVACSPYLFSLN